MTRSKRKQIKRVKVIQSGESTRAIVGSAVPVPVTPATSMGEAGSGIYQLEAPPLQGGRQTQPSNVNPLGMLAYSFLPRRQYQTLDLTDLSSLGRNISAQQLLEMFADLSPHVSKALSNKVLSVNSGYTYSVKTKDGKRDLARAKAMLETIIEGLNKDFGGIDALIDSFAATVVLQGAAAGEIALTDDLQAVQDVYAIQPWTIHFERNSAQELVPFQQQTIGVASQGQGFGVGGYPFKRLNPLTFTYIPYQNFPDDPYGRSPIATVLQVIAFDLQLQKDIRQWAHVNAWGRIDISVVEEMLFKNAPSALSNDPTGQKKRTWVADQVRAFSDSYARIKPDDAFIHSDAVKVTSVDASGKTFSVDGLLRAVDRRMFMALQELPVLMGSNEGTTETHGSIQFEIYSKHIASIQRLIANLLERLFSVALQVYGVSCKVIWAFDPIRSTERLSDAQAEMLEDQIAAYQRDQGWVTQDEASIQITGSAAVAEPKATPAFVTPTALPQAKAVVTTPAAPPVDTGSGDTTGDGIAAEGKAAA